MGASDKHWSAGWHRMVLAAIYCLVLMTSIVTSLEADDNIRDWNNVISENELLNSRGGDSNSLEDINTSSKGIDYSDMENDSAELPIGGTDGDETVAKRFNLVAPSLGKRFMLTSPALGKRFNLVAPSLGKRYNLVAPSLGKRFSLISPSLGKRYNLVAPSLGKRYSLVSPSLGKRLRHALVSPALGKRDDRDFEKEEIFDENKRFNLVAPSLGKRFSLVSPALGKKFSGIVAPALGKREDEKRFSGLYQPSLGKRFSLVAPSLGKRFSLTAPSLGKRAFGLTSPSLGKRFNLVAPSLGKKFSQLVSPALGKRFNLVAPSLGKKNSDMDDLDEALSRQKRDAKEDTETDQHVMKRSVSWIRKTKAMSWPLQGRNLFRAGALGKRAEAKQ